MRGASDTLLIHRVIARLNVGGPAMHVVHLAERLNDGRPFRTRLIAGEIEPEEGDMSYYAAERGVEVTTIPAMARSVSPLRDLRSLWRLYRLLRRERPDVVHTHTSKAGALGRLAAALAGVPVRIHTFHGHVFKGEYFSRGRTALFRRVEQAMARLSTRIVALTEGQKRELSEEVGIAPPHKFQVVPLGLELDRFAKLRGRERAAARREARAELGLGEDEPVVGIVGRVVPVKNHELLFDALPRLLELLRRGEGDDGPRKAGVTAAAPELTVLVVGDGERRAELEAYVRALGVADRVRFLGWRRDLERLYPAMDALALTSKDEGTPVAIIEAMAAGVPVVARDVGGVREVLDDGRWGRLVEWPDPAEVAERLADALRSPPDAEEREAARASAVERFGVERLVDDLRSLYLRELERAGVTSPAGP